MSKDNTARSTENIRIVEKDEITMAAKAEDLKYNRQWTPGGANSNDSLSIVYELVNPGSFVLDVGCSVGQLGAALKERKGCKVFGLELSPEAAKIAEGVLDQVFVQDVCKTDFLKLGNGELFDYIIFADVLEHLSDPVTVLQNTTEALSPKGSILISLPNVAHASVRLALLEGSFEYRSEGLLDNTHVKFYTRDSVQLLLQQANLCAVEVRRTYLGARDTEIPLPQSSVVNDSLIIAIEDLEEATTYQFILQAVPAVNEYYGDLLRTRLNNLENELIKSEHARRELASSFSRQEEWAQQSRKDIERVDQSLRQTQDDVLAIAADLRKRLKEVLQGEVARKGEIDKMGTAIMQLAGMAQARFQELDAKTRLCSERMERYVNIWPLRILRRLRKKLLGV